MSKRRHQNPTPKRREGGWYLRLWQDGFDKDGRPVRKLARIKLAEASMSERQVKKIADELVRPINQELVKVGAAVNFG